MRGKNIPILFEKKEECCGCRACYAVCSKKAISMKIDKEGFEYPIIDKEKCVYCNLCQKVCPLKKSSIN
ncbi:4Fe-4S dicluster domain-containing protein [Eubacterium sp.]|uniref:4Fe-4S dicluster domain-containing protein n=1 Tax=Eubacterium sp. TaxID=142586 RepID=UPI00352067A7